MSSSAQQMRRWTGPAVLSYGFRPFFLLGALWAALAMLLWILALSGALDLPTAFDPVSWHVHALLFGFLPAIVAGFMLTAVPNWTGRLPVVGWPLAVLVLFWLAGRLAVLFSAQLPPLLVAIVDLSALSLLAGMMGREIIAGKNWRNLIVLAMLGVLMLGNLLFHVEAYRGDYPATGYGSRIGLAAGIMMISVIGGRIVPSFTRNWLVQRQDPRRPAPPMQRFDKLSLLVSLIALGLWVALPHSILTGFALLLMGLVQLARIARWCGHATLAEPLLWVLHLGYVFVPLGALALGLATLRPDLLTVAAAQHVWMAGALAMMTLAVMARATLGHTGHALQAGAGTVAIYVAVAISVLARLLAGGLPEFATPLYHVAALSWILAFGGFAALYGPLLMRPRPGRG